MIAMVMEVGGHLGVAATCNAFGLPRATFYRRSTASLEFYGPLKPRRKPVQALGDAERQAVLDLLHQDRFIDLAPTEVYAQLLDEGQHLCSIRTMYRILGANEEIRERRRQRQHPQYSKPELLATGPNQVWSWDITKLRGPVKHTYYYLYVVLDIFSRKAVGWLIADKESASLANHLVREACNNEGIERGQLIIHMDRGAAMKAKTFAQTLGTLGVTKSHSRPYVSDDNPYSEAGFKTLKYRPDFPDRFDSIFHAETHCRDFFGWYNHEHHHSSIGLMTPNDIHSGVASAKREARALVLLAAYAAHPERFPNGKPTPPPLPTAAWINKPATGPANAETAEKRAPQSTQAVGASAVQVTNMATIGGGPHAL